VEWKKIVDSFLQTKSPVSSREPLDTHLAIIFQGKEEEAPALFRRELHTEEFFDLFFHEKLLDVVESILGHKDLRLFPNYTLRPKLPNSFLHTVAWHQDAGLSGDGSPNEAPIEERLESFGLENMINLWTPLVPVNIENGCMRVIPGTHHLGIVPHVIDRSIGDQSAPLYSAQIASSFLEPRLKDAIPIIADPGDLVLFSNLLFHGAFPNMAKTIRWSLDWRYQDASKPTCRKEIGHVVRSRKNPSSVEITTPVQWAQAQFM